jgi:hypothetical protein
VTAAVQQVRETRSNSNNFLHAAFFLCANPPSIGDYRHSGVPGLVIGELRGRDEMATLDEIGQEKQRISERLARVEAERTKLADQLNELEVAERVLTRFGGSADTAERRRRGRPARTAPATGAQRRPRGSKPAPSVSLSDATLQAVKAHPQGATANEICHGNSAWRFGRTISGLRCSAIAAPVDSKTAISAGTCRHRC